MITFEVKFKQLHTNLKSSLSNTTTCHRTYHLPKMDLKNLIHPFIWPFTTILLILTYEDLAGFQPTVFSVSLYLLRH